MPSCGDRSCHTCQLAVACYDAGFVDDAEAWRYLEGQGYTEDRFLIKKPEEGYEPTDKDVAAICFLINEWDWGYEGSEKPEKEPMREQDIRPGSDGGPVVSWPPQEQLFPKLAEEESRLDNLTRRVKKLEDWQHEMITTPQAEAVQQAAGWMDRALVAEKAYDALLKAHPQTMAVKVMEYTMRNPDGVGQITACHCPFCHGVDLDVTTATDGSQHWAMVKCNACQCEGPMVETTATARQESYLPAAVTAWNKRGTA